MSMISQYIVDGVLTPLPELMQLAAAGRLSVVGTSTQTTANGSVIVTSHFTTNPVGGGVMSSFYGNKSAEYKQRFNKKVAMA